VNDPAASRALYEKLDFAVVGGDAAQNWLILRNGSVTVGLFQGMLERNILTFNPGWDEHATAVDRVPDVREHQRRLRPVGSRSWPRPTKREPGRRASCWSTRTAIRSSSIST